MKALRRLIEDHQTSIALSVNTAQGENASVTDLSAPLGLLAQQLRQTIKAVWPSVAQVTQESFPQAMRSELAALAMACGDDDLAKSIRAASADETKTVRPPETTETPLVVPPPHFHATHRHAPLYQSQARAYSALCARSFLFFDLPFRQLHGLEDLRLHTMLAGPTGCGKSSLVERLAHDTSAAFMRLSVGSWIVQGADVSHGTPAVTQIVQLMLRSPRVIVFIDEFDKLSFDTKNAQDWARSIANDIFDLLDGRLNWFGLHSRECVRRGIDPVASSPDRLAQYFRERVFFVCAGTWQTEHTISRCGQDIPEAVRERADFPPELARRLHGEWLTIDYPEREELESLLKKQDIYLLATKCEHPVDLHGIYGQVLRRGMSAVDDLRASIALKAHAKIKL